MLAAMNPTFSIVIPSLRGESYLIEAVKSVLSQDFKDYELIVSLNGPSPEFESWASTLHSKQMRILKWPEINSMSSHWQRALSEALGRYVMILGDDDGLMPSALHDANRIIGKRPDCDIYWFRRAYFFWPGYPRRAKKPRVLSLASRTVFSFKTRPLFFLALLGFIEHFSMPQLYATSFWRRTFLTQALAQSGSIKIKDLQPDVYSGVCAAVNNANTLFVLKPLSWVGTSLKSSHIRDTDNSLPNSLLDHVNLSQQEGMPVHVEVSETLFRNGGTPIWVANAYLSQSQKNQRSESFVRLLGAVGLIAQSTFAHATGRKLAYPWHRVLIEGLRSTNRPSLVLALAFLLTPLLISTWLFKKLYRLVLFTSNRFSMPSRYLVSWTEEFLPKISIANSYLVNRKL
jgi:hypothetical protein